MSAEVRAHHRHPHLDIADCAQRGDQLPRLAGGRRRPPIGPDALNSCWSVTSLRCRKGRRLTPDSHLPREVLADTRRGDTRNLRVRDDVTAVRHIVLGATAPVGDTLQVARSQLRRAKVGAVDVNVLATIRTGVLCTVTTEVRDGRRHVGRRRGRRRLVGNRDRPRHFPASTRGSKAPDLLVVLDHVAVEAVVLVIVVVRAVDNPVHGILAPGAKVAAHDRHVLKTVGLVSLSQLARGASIALVVDYHRVAVPGTGRVRRRALSLDRHLQPQVVSDTSHRGALKHALRLDRAVRSVLGPVRLMNDAPRVERARTWAVGDKKRAIVRCAAEVVTSDTEGTITGGWATLDTSPSNAVNFGNNWRMVRGGHVLRSDSVVVALFADPHDPVHVHASSNNRCALD
mmetsp:Transcript_134503/g.326885  ORF Transcript_134503/g.326885 Transcript_134503/m.326885 type:complete len:400 (+) Transcript_134503:5736-6935(+)